MATLNAEVKARFSTQHIVNLTNPQKVSGNTIDEGRLDKAIADVQAMIEIYAGVAYVETNALHVGTAVFAVQQFLRVYNGQLDAEETREKIVAAFKALGLVTGRNRMLPMTNSRLVPSSDPGHPPVPEFDRRYFDNLVPDVPGGGGPPYVSP